MPWTVQDLEARARGIVASLHYAKDDPVLAGIESQIALMSVHLTQVQERHRRDAIEITQTECDIGTDIMRVHDIRYLHFLAKMRTVDSLKTKLLNLDFERRRMQSGYESEVRRLQERLLHLFIEREHLRT